MILMQACLVRKRSSRSWTALSVIAMIDEEYDVKIKGDDVRNSQTVNDLYEIVKSRL